MKIYHHYSKPEGAHRYYTSLTALCIDLEGELGVSKFTLDRWDWSKPYENELCVIRRGRAITTTEARKFHAVPVKTCTACRNELTLVRPGKWQCDHCEPVTND